MRKVLLIPWVIVAFTAMGCTVDLGALRVTSIGVDAGATDGIPITVTPDAGFDVEPPRLDTHVNVFDTVSVLQNDGAVDARPDMQTMPDLGSDSVADTRFVPDLVATPDSMDNLDASFRFPDTQNDTIAVVADVLKDTTPASVDALVCITKSANSMAAQFGTVPEYCFKVCLTGNFWQCSGYGFINGTRVVTVNGQKVTCTSTLKTPGTGSTLPATVNGAYTFYVSGAGGDFDEIDFSPSQACP